MLYDFLKNISVCSSGKCGDNRSFGERKAVYKLSYAPVGGSEILAPDRNTMGFVDYEQGDIKTAEKVLFIPQGFGRCVYDFDIALPASKLLFQLISLFFTELSD